MKRGYVSCLILLWLAACATYMPVSVHPGDSASVSIHRIFIKTPADGRDRMALRARMVRRLERALPQIEVVDHPALADAVLSWVVTPGRSCVDCGDLAYTGWSWMGTLRASHGSGLVTFFGSTQFGRCFPDEALFRQVVRYLKRNGAAPFVASQAGAGDW